MLNEKVNGRYTVQTERKIPRLKTLNVSIKRAGKKRVAVAGPKTVSNQKD